MEILFKEETEQVAGGCVLCGDPCLEFNSKAFLRGFKPSAALSIGIGMPLLIISDIYGGPAYGTIAQVKFAANLILDGIASRLPEFKPDPNFDYDRELSLSFV